MRQDVFVVAYQEARSELLDITCKYEELLKRKESLEGVLAALGPLVGADMPAAVVPDPMLTVSPIQSAPVEIAPELVQPAPQTDAPAAQNDEDDITDPFQRRLRDALRFSAPRREGLLKAI
jgi:hypothetical protein